MTRPTPRRSALSGSSPIAPAPVAPASEPTREVPPAAAPVETPAEPPRQPRAAASGKKYPPKVSFYQDPANTARVRGAIRATQLAEGHRGLSDFIDKAVMAEVQRLEDRYNNGNPFPPVESGEMPVGRRMGE